MKKTITAKFTDSSGKLHICKREVELFDGNDEKTKFANVGKTLSEQADMRDKYKAKLGLKVAKVGGEDVDYSKIATI